ncbi:protein translocase subunit SecF, partial [archaeon]|nr:protein translocase subunit SecF [archaeon]
SKQETATEQSKEHKRQKLNPFFQFYEKYNVKLMWITVILLILSIIVIGVHTAVKGEFIPRGISLKGGITVTIPYEGGAISPESLQAYLEGQFPSASISVREMSIAGSSKGFIIDASDVDPDEMVKSVEKRTGKLEKISVETIESALGQAFFKQTMLAMLAAFVLMSIVVFLSFKTFVPSAAVILSAVSDIAMTIAVIDIFGIKVETAGIAALLMLIGYSVDTDILLTTRVLKREEGTLMDRILGAMKTGMTMTITAIVAVLVAFIFTQSETLRQIMLILMIGLFFDILNTWIQNTGILTLYVRHKAKKHAAATLSDYKEAKEADFEEIVDLEEETEEEPEEKPEHKEHHAEHHPTHGEHTHAEHAEEPKHEHQHTHQHHNPEEKR